MIDVPIWDQESGEIDLRVAQLRVLAKGYKSLAERAPILPATNSQLPVLIAARELDRLVPETLESVRSTVTSLRESRRDLQEEFTSLADSENLNQIFERRVKELKSSASQAQEDDSHTIAVRLMDSEKLQTRKYRDDRTALATALAEFISTRLAPFLAAEELGGPVTGSVLNITDEMLAAGFSDKGKVNRGRKTDDDHRQRRIDEMFGNLAVQAGADDIGAEATIAAQAMNDLLEKLIQLAFDSGGGRFLQLEKEDAASRYLVRSKVAVLDPRDGRKIRLVDFGKPLDDWL